MKRIRARLRHVVYVVAWALVGNMHHNPPTHGQHMRRP